MPQQKKIEVPIFWIYGGPGCGKGTQCEKIRQKYGFIHISVGDLLRNEVSRGSERGKRLGIIMSEGGLVPNEIALELLKTEMYCTLCNARGFIIDGYPRQVQQGIMFEKKVAPVTAMIYFEIAESEMIDRLRKRAKSSGRSDDFEMIFRKRIERFDHNKDDILTQYEPKLKKIDGGRSADVVFADVEKLINILIQSSKDA